MASERRRSDARPGQLHNLGIAVGKDTHVDAGSLGHKCLADDGLGLEPPVLAYAHGWARLAGNLSEVFQQRPQPPCREGLGPQWPSAEGVEDMATEQPRPDTAERVRFVEEVEAGNLPRTATMAPRAPFG